MSKGSRAPLELHVAALPFPSRQGTQVYLEALLRERRRAGIDARLLVYGAHSRRSKDPNWLLRAGGGRLGVSLRSGPTPRKLLHDVALGRALARLAPRKVIAHHVEAYLLARLCCPQAQVSYVAHTRLAEELATYAPQALSWLLNRAGAWLDGYCSRSDEALAVSPALAESLGGSVLPAPHFTTQTSMPRDQARQALALHADTRWFAYVGNLDAYQGTDVLPRTLAALPAHWQLLLMSQQRDAQWLRQVPETLRERIAWRPLRRAERRCLAYAAADVVVVPRACGRGIPVKLLDAMAAKVPVAAQPEALAGFNFPGLYCARDRSPSSLAQAIQQAASSG